MINSQDSQGTLRQRVLATMKSPDTEGPFELYVTRMPGYLWALAFRSIGFHPIAVTLLSIVIGAAAGFFFYSTQLRYNLIGMGLLVWANWYDCADGQLARMTGKRTLIGRILDGFAGDVWFFSIYFFLCLRITQTAAPWGEPWGIWIWLLAAWAGLHCHVLQCNVADYYRNIHLYFLSHNTGSEFDRCCKLRKQMRSMKWLSDQWFNKLYLFFYARYTERQERMTPQFQQLYKALVKAYPDGQLPQTLRQQFRQGSLPLMPLCNILTFDTRVGVLFFTLLVGQPWLYFVFEIVVLDTLRHYVIRRHEALCTTLRKEVEA